MVTPDKDFAQLISTSTCMWKPGRKGSDHEVIDLPTMLSHWEIERPEQVIDILGLWGDAADNIPGIPGIGEKTAKKLIVEYGSIEKWSCDFDTVMKEDGEVKLQVVADFFC